MNIPTLIKSWSLSFQISTPWFRWTVGLYLRLSFGFYNDGDVCWLWLGPIAIASVRPYQYEDQYPYGRLDKH